MRIRTKLMILVLGLIFVMGAVSMMISVGSIRKQAKTELKAIENTLLTHKKEMLKVIINNAYTIIDTAYKEANNPEKLTQSIQNELKNAVDLAFTSLVEIYENAGMDDSAKKELALELIKSLRFNSTNYFWVAGLDLTMVAHPIHPEWEGRDISKLKDINGQPIFPDLVEVGKKEKEAFFNYIWVDPDTREQVPNLGYARVFDPWQWAIGAAIKVEVAQQGIQQRAKKTVATLRYGTESKDYFWIHNTNLEMVMHPINPKLDGTDLSQMADPTGKFLFKDMVAVCEARGEGFVDYMWPKPGQETPVPKISYVKLFKPYGWIVGTGVYIDDIQRQINAKADELHQRVIATVVKQLLLLVIASATILATTFFVARKISSPLVNTSRMLKDIAQGEGDLTQRIQLTSKDETGELAKWFNYFVENLQQLIRQIGEHAGILGQSASDMTDIAGNLNHEAGNMSAKTDSATTSTERMNANIQSVASATDETARNVNMMADSTEGMSSTINEIAENTQKARTISQEAVGQSQLATENVNQLGQMAQNIGQITEVITEISEQTNLLALNATIEAARAGDAGKGFAVVANEIKELARQTAEATLKIKEQITEIQNSSEKAEENINKISQVIDAINDIVSSIAAAIEEQSAATKEIAVNIAHSSQQITTVNANLAQSSKASEEISNEILEVNTSARHITESSNKVSSNAENLNQLAQQLGQLVGRFKV